MATNWFEQLMGFQERSHAETRANLEVVGTMLRSRVNHRSYSIGELETPTLRELRQQAVSVVDRAAGKLKVTNVAGDVRNMHGDPINKYALFQVASQFNLLEMVGPHVSPEDGVTRYADDHTQGPACAIAAGAATILVLEGAYEATLWAAVINAHRFSSKILFLTQLGGGAFGNDTRWIHDAIRRALKKVVAVDLDVRLVSYGGQDPGLERLAQEFV